MSHSRFLSWGASPCPPPWLAPTTTLAQPGTAGDHLSRTALPCRSVGGRSCAGEGTNTRGSPLPRHTHPPLSRLIGPSLPSGALLPRPEASRTIPWHDHRCSSPSL